MMKQTFYTTDKSLQKPDDPREIAACYSDRLFVWPDTLADRAVRVNEVFWYIASLIANMHDEVDLSSLPADTRAALDDITDAMETLGCQTLSQFEIDGGGWSTGYSSARDQARGPKVRCVPVAGAKPKRAKTAGAKGPKQPSAAAH